MTKGPKEILRKSLREAGFNKYQGADLVSGWTGVLWLKLVCLFNDMVLAIWEDMEGGHPIHYETTLQ